MLGTGTWEHGKVLSDSSYKVEDNQKLEGYRDIGRS